MQNPTVSELYSILTPERVLRFGLGVVFLYAGIAAISDPTTWVSFVPAWISAILSPLSFLWIHAIAELILGVSLILGIYIPIASLAGALDLLSILVFYGIDAITFRDVGLFLAAIALFLLASHNKNSTT